MAARGVEGIHVYVLYPKGKVSEIQEKQFTTLGRNITALEVESMVQAAKFIDEHSNCDIIDINCGCPVNKVLKANAGSKLLQNPQLIYDIVSNIVKNVSKPVTVKIRRTL